MPAWWLLCTDDRRVWQSEGGVDGLLSTARLDRRHGLQVHGLRNAFDSIGWRRDQMSRIQSVQPFQQGCVTALVASCGVSSTADRSLTRVVEELVDKCFPVAQDLLKAQPCCRGFLSLQGEVDKATRMHRIAVKIVELARSCVARSQEACAMPQWSDVACAINDCLDSCTQLEASSSAHTSSCSERLPDT